MLLRTILIIYIGLVILGCKRNEIPDPDENIQSFISFKADGKEYLIRNGAPNQYIQYLIEYDPTSRLGYRLEVGGGDSVSIAPTFFISVKSDSKVVEREYISDPFIPDRKIESMIGGILPKSNDLSDYIGYFSETNAVIEYSEISDFKIKGSFSGTATTNSYAIPSRTKQISDGKFFINRRPGFTTAYKY